MKGRGERAGERWQGKKEIDGKEGLRKRERGREKKGRERQR